MNPISFSFHPIGYDVLLLNRAHPKDVTLFECVHLLMVDRWATWRDLGHVSLEEWVKTRYLTQATSKDSVRSLGTQYRAVSGYPYF